MMESMMVEGAGLGNGSAAAYEHDDGNATSDSSAQSGGEGQNALSSEASDRPTTHALEGVPTFTKTRRGKRGGKNRDWKPYSKMTWEEKAAREKAEELKAHERIEREREAARLAAQPSETLSSKKRRKKQKRKGSEACPPAPRNTTAFLIAEHNMNIPSPTPFPHTPSGGLSGALSPMHGDDVPYGFETDYEQAVYGEFEDMSKEQLIRELRKAHEEIDELRTLARRRSLEGEDQHAVILSLRDEVAALKYELDLSRNHGDTAAADDAGQQ